MCLKRKKYTARFVKHFDGLFYIQYKNIFGKWKTFKGHGEYAWLFEIGKEDRALRTFRWIMGREADKDSIVWM